MLNNKITYTGMKLWYLCELQCEIRAKKRDFFVKFRRLCPVRQGEARGGPFSGLMTAPVPKVGTGNLGVRSLHAY